MIHHDRGNRRRTDRRKRKSKFAKAQAIWGDASTYMKGILGMYDKGKIHDTLYYEKTNARVASTDRVKGNRLGNNYSISDKRKVESCNEQTKEFEIETTGDWTCAVRSKKADNFLLDSDEGIVIDKRSNNVPVGEA